MRSSPFESFQYVTPRLYGRGNKLARSPSSSRYIHNVSPVSASAAITARRCPAVKYSRPPIINGVVSMLPSLRGPKLFDFHRHATRNLLTLSALI